MQTITIDSILAWYGQVKSSNKCMEVFVARCREDFRPWAENRAKQANPRCAPLHIHVLYFILSIVISVVLEMHLRICKV